MRHFRVWLPNFDVLLVLYVFVGFGLLIALHCDSLFITPRPRYLCSSLFQALGQWRRSGSGEERGADPARRPPSFSMVPTD